MSTVPQLMGSVIAASYCALALWLMFVGIVVVRYISPALVASLQGLLFHVAMDFKLRERKASPERARAAAYRLIENKYPAGELGLEEQLLDIWECVSSNDDTAIECATLAFGRCVSSPLRAMA